MVQPGFVLRNRSIFIYGACMAVLLFLLKWLELRFIIMDHSFELYAGVIALLFTSLGMWLALKLSHPKMKTVVVEKEVRVSAGEPFRLNEEEMLRLGLSKRELEVLQRMSEGMSNKEIASRLFISLNTVKTHTSRIFEKLEVRRRTQAVEKAKRSSLIP